MIQSQGAGASYEARPEGDQALSTHEKAIQALIQRQGGDVWGEDNSFPRTSWIDEVIQGDTQQGYWEWVLHRHEEDSVAST